MEQARFDHKSGAVRYLPDVATCSPIKSNTNPEKRRRDQLLFDETIRLGGDWLAASGGVSLTEKQFSSLYEAGFVSYPAGGVLEIFHDWEDYQRIAEIFYADSVEAQSKKEVELYKAIKQECEIGVAPEVFLREFALYTVGYCEVAPASGQKGKVKKLQRYEETGGQADVKTVIQRYSKYQLADHLLKDRPSNEPVSERRKASIAMGFGIDNGKPLSSFSGAMKNSFQFLLDSDVERASEELGIYDYIYPNSRSSHLKSLLAATRPKRVNINYKLSFPLELLDYEPEETYYDLDRTNLILGQTAVQAAMVKGRNILSLTQLLSDQDCDIASKADRQRFKEWTKEDCLNYGRWLIKILNGESRFTYYTLERASKLRLGLGINGVSNRFEGSLNGYFEELQVSKKNVRGRYNNSSYQDMVDHVKLVADQNAGKISERLLRQYYQEQKEKGIKVPSPAIIQKVCNAQIGEVFEAAGFKVKRKVDAEACIFGAVRFYDENGRFPKVADIIETPYLHSWPTIRRYCGSISGLTELAQRAMVLRVDNGQIGQRAAA
jgi:hypothetical protein